MHAAVDALENIRKAVDMDDLRLLAQPVGKLLNLGKVGWFRDATGFAGVQCVIDKVHPRQILDHEVGVWAKLYSFVKVVDEHIVEFIPGNHQNQGHDHKAYGRHEDPAMLNDPVAKAGHHLRDQAASVAGLCR